LEFTVGRVHYKYIVPCRCPQKAQAPGKFLTGANYPALHHLMLHYLCVQHHKREEWTEGVGESKIERDQSRRILIENVCLNTESKALLI